MQNQSLIFENGWKALDYIRRTGDRITVLGLANALKMIEPNTTYEEYKAIMKKLYGREGRFSDWPFVPDEFEWLIKSFAKKTNASSVLVPFATGLENDCFSDDVEVDYRFFNNELEQATALFAHINVLPELPEKCQYDLIISALPLGPVNSKALACQIAELSFPLLKENGYCLFTFPRGIIWGIGAKWLEKLEDTGIYCTAIVDMPKGAYAPGTMIDTEIVVFSRTKAEKRFVALLDDEDSSDRIVDNYLNGKVPQNASKLGVLIDSTEGCYSVYMEGLRAQKQIKKLEKAYNGKHRLLSEFSVANAPNKNHGFQDNDYAVYVPKLGNSPVVTEIDDFRIKPQNYFQLLVDPEIMLPRFLAFFLNSEEGVTLRQHLYNGIIPAFNKATVLEMSIPCPALELQSEYVKTYDQLEALRIEVESLKNKLSKRPASYKNIRKEIKDVNNTGDRFVQWIESLPYPIATILKRYSVSDNPTSMQEMLLYFYEAYAIFEATLLSAALNKELLDCSDLSRIVDPTSFEKASFGNWVRMDRALSNLYLEAVNGSDEEKKKAVLECFKTSDDNMIRLLCSKNVCNLLENASKYRNDWRGHSGITSDTIYREHSAILDSMLHKMQESIKDLYERVRLIRPVSLDYRNGLFDNTVEVLTGSNPIFTKEIITLTNPLDKEKLYLQIMDTEETLELPPYFILKNSPADVKNACYFYSKVEHEDSKYVSYHYDGRPEDTESGKKAFEHIQELLTN